MWWQFIPRSAAFHSITSLEHLRTRMPTDTQIQHEWRFDNPSNVKCNAPDSKTVHCTVTRRRYVSTHEADSVNETRKKRATGHSRQITGSSGMRVVTYWLIWDPNGHQGPSQFTTSHCLSGLFLSLLATRRWLIIGSPRAEIFSRPNSQPVTTPWCEYQRRKWIFFRGHYTVSSNTLD